MSNQKPLLMYHEIMSQVNQLCLNRETGTVFIRSNDNRAVGFILKQGEIISCYFGHERGVEALRSIKNIIFGTFAFSDNIFLSSQEDEITPLGTQLVFEELGLEYLEELPALMDEKTATNTKIYRGAVVSEDSSSTPKSQKSRRRVYRGKVFDK